MAAVDPNWLLSTTAQSAAALVGIVGGFLVSRVIAIASERQGLVRRSRELRELIELNNMRADEIEQQRLDDALWKFGDMLAERIVVEGESDVGVLIDDFDPPGSSHDDLYARGPELIRVMRNVADRLHALYGDGPYPTSRRGLADEGVDMADAEPWLYERVAQVLNRATAGKRGVAAIITSSSIPAPTSGRTFRDQQDEKERDEAHLRASISSLIGEQALVDIEASRLSGLPRGVLPGVTVLTFFGTVGILLPLYEMSQRPVASDASTRSWVFAGFAAGFGSLIAYLFWVVAVLTRDRSETKREWLHRQRIRLRQRHREPPSGIQ